MVSNDTRILQNVTVERVPFVRHILEVSSSKLSPNIGYPKLKVLVAFLSSFRREWPDISSD
jgi:hypothetical protein